MQKNNSIIIVNLFLEVRHLLIIKDLHNLLKIK
jgi:hypothetical protein